ncbi:MAG: TetR/AcrR family transcriptional regulator [Chloroflexota bacterium]
MGRRDLSEERCDQILDAFQHCIVRHGLASTTVTKVAEAAGMKRSIIHHYVGDRNDLLAALLQRYIEQDQQAFADHLAGQTTPPDIDRLLDFLFSGWLKADPHVGIIVNSLLAETAHNLQLRELCYQAYKVVQDGIADVIGAQYPSTPPERCQLIAHAIFSLLNGNLAMRVLGLDQAGQPEMRELVKELIQTLETAV